MPTKTLQNALRNAKSGNFKQLKKILLENKEEIKYSDLVYKVSGDSIMHIAAVSGTPTDLQFILNHFNKPTLINCKNKDDKTPLHEACQFARLDNVKFLLDNNADVNAIKRADWTPLMLTCAKTNLENSVEIADLLIKNGALVNLCNKDGWNALHLTARDGNVRLFRFLLLTTTTNDLLNVKTKNGRTVLHIAALHNNHEIVDEILKINPDSVNQRDNCGNTALHEAVLAGNIELCKLLIERGGGIDLKNLVDYDLLHLAASVASVEMIRFLICQLHCNVNVIARNGLTPLHCAARNQRKEACKLLIAMGADVHCKDKFGRSAKDYFNYD